MAIGNPVTTTSINQQVGGLAIGLRNQCNAIKNFFEWVNVVGQAGLVSYGFSSSDATLVLNMASYLNTIAGIYYGTATQATDYNFDNQLCELWGGY